MTTAVQVRTSAQKIVEALARMQTACCDQTIRQPACLAEVQRVQIHADMVQIHLGSELLELLRIRRLEEAPVEITDDDDVVCIRQFLWQIHARTVQVRPSVEERRKWNVPSGGAMKHIGAGRRVV